MQLSGKKALVTGAGTGIGRAVALAFAREGADVVLHYAHSDEGARSAVEEIRALGRRAAAFAADFRVTGDALRLADQAIEFLGGVNCLVSNAGITMTKPFLDVTQAQFDVLYQVNVRAPFFLCQRIIAHMRERGGGVICSVASVHGLQGASEYSAYAATKGAIIAYTRALAVEWAHAGIRLNTIAPGWVTVENYAKAIADYSPEEEQREANRLIPAGRPGTTADVANLAVFLCSDAASFIVGQTLVCDGGTTALSSAKPDFRTPTTARWGLGYVPGV